jgi:dihydroflavonol-4-reductase
MPGTILVTGATGSVGGNICAIASRRGYRVRALVRNVGPAEPLAEFGVELVQGDVTNADSVRTAAKGVDAIIHAAAQIGGTWTTATEADFVAVNQLGSFNVLDAAEANDVPTTVLLLSTVVLDSDFTLTEISPMRRISPENSPYTRTKLAAYYEGMARAARGLSVSFVVPGAIYGPTPLIDRALVPTIFTHTLLSAARGQLSTYLPSTMSWVLAAEVAEVSLAAAEKGRSGARYLGLGRNDDLASLPAACNRFSELVGSEHRVVETDISDPAVLEKYGSMVKYLRTTYPEPHHDQSATCAELGVFPGSLDDGLRATVEWLRQHHKI